MSTQECREAQLLISRRTALGMAAGLFSSAFMPRFAEASPVFDPRLLIVILRGGMDGLSTVIPLGDPDYAEMRGEMAVSSSSAKRLNGFFGIHPALRNFASLYSAGDAAVVHATCVPLRNRSHFDAQDNLENGMPGRAPNATGWLNRLLSVLPTGSPVKRRGGIEIGGSPVILRGPAPVLGWSPTWFAHLDDPLYDAIQRVYREEDPQLHAYLTRGLEANRLAERIGAASDGKIGVLRKGFRGAARLLAASEGPRIAVLSVEGWDTHVHQGCASGTLADRLSELDQGLGDFKGQIGPAWEQTVVLFVTEFGRTVGANGGHGTEHGVGTVSLMAGGAVNGGRVFCDWPGLKPKNLFKESLLPTTDLRSVFKGVLRDHLGVPEALLNKTIFPDSRASAPPLANLIKPSVSRTAAANSNMPIVEARSEPAIARFRREASGGG